MLFCNVSLKFPACLHCQQCPFTAYCVQGSPNIAHNLNELSTFCHCTGWPTSTVPLYTYRVNLYVHVVWRDTLWNCNVVCGNNVNNCIWQPCTMVHSTWHTTSTYKSTQTVCGSTVPSCPSCTGVPFISHLPYCERGHWKISDANIVINGYHGCRWWG